MRRWLLLFVSCLVPASAIASIPPSAVAEEWTCAVPAIAIDGDPILTRWAHTGDAARAFAAGLVATIGLPLPAVTAAVVGLLRSGVALVALTHPDGSCTSLLISPNVWQRMLRRSHES